MTRMVRDTSEDGEDVQFTPFKGVPAFTVRNFGEVVNAMAEEAHRNAKAKGFWDNPKSTGDMAALIHSEVSEFLEVCRVDETAMSEKIPEHYATEDELADIVIRVFDTAVALQLDIGGTILAKMAYNESRPRKHGNKKF